MRWEYVDRSRVAVSSPLDDESRRHGQMVYFGNMHAGTVMLDAKPIPGTDMVASIFSPGHGEKEHAGQMAIVDPDAGPGQSVDGPTSDRQARPTTAIPIRSPSDCFSWPTPTGILLMDGDGRTQEIYRARPSRRHDAARAASRCAPARASRSFPPRVDLASRPGGWSWPT